MTKRRVWRYKCDYCAKSNCSAGGMAQHEKHCTLNPNRECRMCESGWPKPELLAVLDGAEEKLYVYWDADADDQEHAAKTAGRKVINDGLLAALHTEADGCPACMLSAIRQSCHEGYFDWDYKAACETWWKEHERGTE